MRSDLVTVVLSRACDHDGLCEDEPRIVREMQHLMDGDRIERRFAPRQAIHVALAHIDVGEIRLGKIGPRDAQHLRRLVDAYAACAPCTEKLEDAPADAAAIEAAAEKKKRAFLVLLFILVVALGACSAARYVRKKKASGGGVSIVTGGTGPPIEDLTAY